MIFRGSHAIQSGELTRGQLRSARFVNLCRDVYTDSRTKVTHEVRCRGAALVLPPDAVITGRSAATLRGCPLARAGDPVEVVAALDRRVTRRAGIDLRRTTLTDDDSLPWGPVRIASPLRMALDLALDRPLPDAVADLDAAVRADLVDRAALATFVRDRSERGIVSARHAVSLIDPRAESRPESQVRVWLVLAGLTPVPQYWIEDRSGRIARGDLAFPEWKLLVEYDGEWRSDQLWALNHDRARLNRVHATGWQTMFVTKALLAEPRRMVYTVEAALRACGAPI